MPDLVVPYCSFALANPLDTTPLAVNHRLVIASDYALVADNVIT